MLFSLTSRIVSALAAFLYPGYASYKTLSQRPASEAELERWLMYWSVLGCVVGVEYLAEWLVSWIPLYTTLKAIFFLYLALPQTQGASYIYMVHLRPFFATHEGQIDSAIAEVRGRLYTFLQEKARAVWAAMLGALTSGGDGANGSGVGGQSAWPAGTGAGAGARGQPPPTLNNPASGPAQLVSSLWTSYGPSIIAGGAALLRQTAAATLPGGSTAGSARADAARSKELNTPPGSTFFNQSTTVDPLIERRRQLEAELAALPPYAPTASIPPANNPARPSLSSFTPSSSGSSSEGVRERKISGKFEEIKGGDVEGYEVDHEDFVGGFVVGDPATPNKSGRSNSWFGGWGSGGKDRGSYERVKNE
ncbi:TB2/DP1, HVA22 family-domain-containing protein [Crassisporium funariophilum]|nr:TB2/DP1, HVA22 family-domain-containing protein [Crassisporium funariophilum]